MTGDDGFLARLLSEANASDRDSLRNAIQEQKNVLERSGFFREKLAETVVSEGYRAAGELCRRVVRPSFAIVSGSAPAPHRPGCWARRAHWHSAHAGAAGAGAVPDHIGRQRAVCVAERNAVRT